MGLAGDLQKKGAAQVPISFTGLFGVVRSKLVPTAISGIQENAEPSKRLDIDIYKEGNAQQLPLDTLDAIRLFERSSFVADNKRGKEFQQAFTKLKRAEWNDHMRHFSTWERLNAWDV